MSASEGHEKDLVNMAVFVFAHYLGIDLEKEEDLIWIAEEAFEKLPEGWEFGVSEEGDHAGIPYFYNSITGESVWNHPEEDKYKRKLKRERQAKKDNRGRRSSQMTRNNSGSTVSSSPNPTDRSQTSQGHTSNQQSNNQRAIKELTVVEEVVDFEQDEPQPAKNTNNKTNNARPGFGLSEDDFFDIPATTNGSKNDGNREHSPPLFKDLKLTGDSLPNNTNNTSNNRSNSQTNTSTTQGNKASTIVGSQQSQGGDRWFRVPGEQQTTQQKRSERDEYPPVRRLENAWDSGNNNSVNNNGNNRNNNSGDNNRGRSNNNTTSNLRETSREGRDRDLSYSNNNNNSGRSPTRSQQQQQQQQLQQPQIVSVIDESALLQAQQAAQQILSQQQQSLSQQVSLLQTQHSQNLQNLRDDLRLAEQRLSEEKLARATIEGQLQRAQSDLLRLQRESDEANELKLREVLRKARAELEDEFRERLRQAERKSIEEVDASRNEVLVQKRKLDEVLREMDLLKRRLLQSKDEGRMDAEKDISTLKQSLRDLEEENNRCKTEIKRCKEEISAQLSRVATAQTLTQQQATELEALRLSQQKAVHEAQVQAAAFMQASQRLATNESEYATLKAELHSLRSTRDQLEIEVKRLRSTSAVSNEAILASENEVKRQKLQLQSEVQRLSAKLAESEAMTRLLRDQNDKLTTDETQAIRSLRTQLDQLENEKKRLLDSLQTHTITNEELQTRIRKMESDSILMQEQVYRKDRALREETQRLENLQTSISSLRNEHETTLSTLKQQIQQQEEKTQQVVRNYEEKIAEIQAEVSERVPRLVTQAKQQLELSLTNKHMQTVNEIQLQYESTLSKKRQEVLEAQAAMAEVMAKERLRSVEEKAELERLRAKVGMMSQQIVEMESMIAGYKQQLQAVSVTSSVGTTHYNKQHNISNTHNSNMSMISTHNPQQQQQLIVQPSKQQQQVSISSAAANNSNTGTVSTKVKGGSYEESFFDFSSLLPPLPPQSLLSQQSQAIAIDNQHQQHDIAVAHLTQELAAMKQTLSRALSDKKHLNTIVNSSIDIGGNTDLASSSIIITAGEGGEAERKELNANNSQRMKSVSFTPESLFHSPQHPVRRGRAIPLQQTQQEEEYIIDMQQQEGEDGGGEVDGLGSTLGSTLNLTFDSSKPMISSRGRPPRYSQFEPMLPLSSPAVIASYPSYGKGSGSNDRRQRSSANSSFADYYDSDKLMNNKQDTSNSSFLSQSLSVLPREHEDFEGIRDGGYHEGYWRAKYSVNMRK